MADKPSTAAAPGTTTPEEDVVDGVRTDEARIAIPGMTQEGEKLATAMVESEEEAMGVSASQEDGKVKGTKIAGTSRADRQASYDLADFPELTGREEGFVADGRLVPGRPLRTEASWVAEHAML